MPFSPGTLHLREVHTQLLSLLLGGLRGVRLLLASSALVLAFALLASFFLLFISATAAGETAGQTAHGVLGLLGRSSGDLSCLVGHLPDLIRDSIQRSSAVLAFGLLVVHNYSLLSMASPGSLLLVRSAGDVPHSDAAFGPGSLNLVEVDAKLLGLLLGGLRGVRLLLLASSGLLGRLLSLLGCLSGNLLSLLGCLTCGVLCLARYLSCLIRRLSRRLLGLSSGLSSRVLHALDGLPYLICDSSQRTSASLVVLLASPGESSHGVLNLSCRLARSVLCLLGNLSGLVRHLTCHLSGLIGGLTGSLLGLASHLPSGVLSLLRSLTSDLLHLLQGLLGSLLHCLLDTRILGRLIHGTLDLRVGVDHLLNLGLRVAFGELLSVLLQLFAVILSLALDPAQ